MPNFIPTPESERVWTSIARLEQDPDFDVFTEYLQSVYDNLVEDSLVDAGEVNMGKRQAVRALLDVCEEARSVARKISEQKQQASAGAPPSFS